MALTSSAPTLREALYELSMTERTLDAALLDEFVRRFPQYREELTEFAIEQALETLAGSVESGDAPKSGTVTPAVSRAMSQFQNRLHAIGRNDPLGKGEPVRASEIINPFASLPRDEFRALARRMGANSVFLGKLRDREIDPETMTDGFVGMVARETRAPLGVVVAHFAAAQVEIRSNRQFYKADEKPRVAKRQSLAEAIRSSGLSEEEQARLLQL